MQDRIICQGCNKAISSRKDLIVALRFFIISPYHASCYATRLKNLETILIRNVPVNSISFTVKSFVAVIVWVAISILLFFTDQISVLLKILFFLGFSIVTLTSGAVRLYSYHKYEKKLAEH